MHRYGGKMVTTHAVCKQLRCNQLHAPSVRPAARSQDVVGLVAVVIRIIHHSRAILQRVEVKLQGKLCQQHS